MPEGQMHFYKIWREKLHLPMLAQVAIVEDLPGSKTVLK